MDLRFAFVANSAEVGPDGRFFVLGGGIDGISLREVPTVYPALAILCRIHFLQVECGLEHRIRLSITNPDGTVGPVLPECATTPIAMVPGHEDRGANLDVAFNLFGLPLPQEGEYGFHFVVDDIDIGAHSFFVRALGPERQGGA